MRSNDSKSICSPRPHNLEHSGWTKIADRPRVFGEQRRVQSSLRKGRCHPSPWRDFVGMPNSGYEHCLVRHELRVGRFVISATRRNFAACARAHSCITRATRIPEVRRRGRVGIVSPPAPVCTNAHRAASDGTHAASNRNTFGSASTSVTRARTEANARNGAQCHARCNGRVVAFDQRRRSHRGQSLWDHTSYRRRYNYYMKHASAAALAQRLRWVSERARLPAQ